MTIELLRQKAVNGSYTDFDIYGGYLANMTIFNLDYSRAGELTIKDIDNLLTDEKLKTKYQLFWQNLFADWQKAHNNLFN